MKAWVRKLAHFVVWYPLYYALWILLLAPAILEQWAYLATLFLIFAIGLLDTVLRPIATARELSCKYTVIMLTMFLTAPLKLILAYYENRWLVSPFFPLWDSIVVSIVGILLLAVGGIITIVGRHQLGSYSMGTITIEDQHQLVTKGLYARIRHPIYLGGLVGSLGAGLAFRSVLVTGLSLLIFFRVFRHRMDAEEKLLENQFGNDYVLYKQRTKRLIPGVY